MAILKNKMTTLSLVLATLALAGCSSCPSVDSQYDQFPYNNMRTAGTGAAIYGGKCAAKPAVQEYVAPAPVVVQKAAPVFTKAQHK